jgi:hypothetical protein
MPLLEVARGLVAHGHTPVFAVRDLVETADAFRDQPFPVLQAPYWNPVHWHGARPFKAASFADVLAYHGYDNADNLLPMVNGWQHLLDQVCPALVVADHSPTLCLAAHGTLPRVMLGSWFCMPPADEPLFPSFPGRQPVCPGEQVLAAVCAVQRRRGRPAPETLTGFLRGDRFLLTLPELDGYRAVRREPWFGPLEFLPAPLPPSARFGFFAYLAADHPNIEAVLAAMAQTGCPGRAYLRGASPELRARLHRQGFEVLERPAALVDALAEARVIVHHGGPGTAQVALAAGRPQVLLPRHFEQEITAQTLHALGVATFAADGPAPATAAGALRQVLLDARLADRAAELAGQIQQRPRPDALAAIIACCLRYL